MFVHLWYNSLLYQRRAIKICPLEVNASWFFLGQWHSVFTFPMKINGRKTLHVWKGKGTQWWLFGSFFKSQFPFFMAFLNGKIHGSPATVLHFSPANYSLLLYSNNPDKKCTLFINYVPLGQSFLHLPCVIFLLYLSTVVAHQWCFKPESIQLWCLVFW